MSTPKNTDKIEKLILGYFNLVNPLPYDEVKIDIRQSEILSVVVIKIIDKEDPMRYTSQRGRERCVAEEIKHDMNDMFPYIFQVHVTFNHPITKELKIKI
jgi:hypothetical protein